MSSAPLPRIDRAAHLRRDGDRLMNALSDPESLLVGVWRDKNLVAPGARALIPSVGSAGALVTAASEVAWLGLVGGKDCFALDLSGVSDPLSLPGLAGGGQLSDLRFVGGALPETEAEILMYARGVLQFHRSHRHCGICGRVTRSQAGGHVRWCEAEDRKIFPRTDPAIMVLVTRGDRCVLTRQRPWPQGFYAALAGFVEPGETLEGAVQREAKEEIGADVNDIRYFRSQPWPYPSSLMLGFFATAARDELVVDREELEDARWVSRAELRDPKGFTYPTSYSLAHLLIQAFLAG